MTVIKWCLRSVRQEGCFYAGKRHRSEISVARYGWLLYREREDITASDEHATRVGLVEY